MSFFNSEDSIFDKVLKDNGLDTLITKLSNLTEEDRTFVYTTMRQSVDTHLSKEMKRRTKERYESLKEAFTDTVDAIVNKDFWDNIKDKGLLETALGSLVFAVHMLMVDQTEPYDIQSRS